MNWLLQKLAFSNSWHAWQERLAALACLLVGCGLLALSLTWLAVWQSAILWSLFALGVALLSHKGFVKLLGPVLFYDMVRTSRRSRYVIIRVLYGGFLLTILFYLYVMVAFTFREQVQRREMAMLAESFFGIFMLVQLVLVVLLTPAYVAGAIAEEKDRKTIEFLLATDLRNREIVLSKLLSRVANMALLLLTGLPIVSILQFMGGVDPNLVFAGFTSIGLTVLGIASLSILFSTLFKRPRDSISLTYIMLVAYMTLGTFTYALRGWPPLDLPIWFGADPPTIKDLIGILNTGNPITTVIDVTQAISGRRGQTLAAELPSILGRYAWFHLTISGICITWSILRVRSIALKQTVAGTTAKLGWLHKLRPRVGEFPMLWKEFYIEGRTKINWLVWLAFLVLVLITLGSGVWILGMHLYDEFVGNFRGRGMWDRIPESMNIWFRVAGTFVGCLLLLMVGVRAATSITHERERDTFDALITTPLSAQNMLVAKLVGNLTSLRMGWLWFGSMLGLALITGGVHPLALPLIAGSLVVYAVFMTMIGLMFSISCKTSLQASTLTVLSTLVLGGAHWLITGCFCMPVFGVIVGFGLGGRGGNQALVEALTKLGEYFIKFQAGITPPFVLAFCSFSWRDLDGMGRGFGGDRHAFELVAFSVLGLFLWAIASGVLWFGVLVPMFRRLARREELVTG